MKKMSFLPLMIMAMIVTGGCAENYALIKASGTSVRHDVFQELTDGAPVPPGHADLRIVSSLKTHKPGIYPSERAAHGTPEYRLLVNIDGQAVQVPGSLHEENRESQGLDDPEAGDGIRYRFSKVLRLKAGAHRLVVALPDDGVAAEREIVLAEGSRNRLVLEPLYRVTPGKRRLGLYGATSFLEGLREFRLFLNDEPI